MIASSLFAKCSKLKDQSGFSLIEMAIVLVILGLLLGGLIMPLSAQREVSQRQATERQLQEIRNALIGFAQANGRLPCPVVLRDGANLAAPGDCPMNAGFVPYAALGIQGAIIDGNLVDVWQQPVRYRLARVNGPAPLFVTWTYAKTPIPTELLTPTAAQPPYFQICANAGPCSAANADAVNVVAVVFSTGEAKPPLSAAESQNTLSTSTNFVNRTLEQNFNDILVWISQPTLIYELSRAGQ